MEKEKHGIPALFSFFIPGLGQAIKGDGVKAVVFFIAAIVAWFTILLLIGLILVPVVHIVAAADAYSS